MPEIFEIYKQSISLKETEHFPNKSRGYREKKRNTWKLGVVRLFWHSVSVLYFVSFLITV